MKTTLISLLVSLAFAPASFAEPKGYTYIFEQPMSQDACIAQAQDFAMQNALVLEQWGPADYYLMGQDGHSGNAYYSEGVCHIYLN